MKIKILCILCAFLLSAVQADVIVSPRQSNTFRFTPDDIWNINVQYIGSGAPKVIIEVAISLIGQGKVFSARSNAVTLTQGLNSYTSVSLGTQQLNYPKNEMAEIVSLLGSFPSGSYTICYVVRCIDPNCNGAGSDAISGESGQCSDLIIEPSTPLVLAFPEDEAILSSNNNRPTFSWIPPSPMNQITGFNYRYTITVARKDQQCEDAILRNRPMYEQSGLINNVLPYPSELNGLDTGKRYCWQVKGQVGTNAIVNSEVWELSLEKEKKDSVQIVYHKLNDLGKSSAGVGRTFGIVLETGRRTAIFNYSISDGATRIEIKNVTEEITYGENRIKVECTLGFQLDKLYIMESTIDGKKQKNIFFKISE
jgi:hypothetical protein